MKLVAVLTFTQQCELYRETTSLNAAAVKLTSVRVSAKGHCHRLSDMTVRQRPHEYTYDLIHSHMKVIAVCEGEN